MQQIQNLLKKILLFILIYVVLQWCLWSVFLLPALVIFSCLLINVLFNTLQHMTSRQLITDLHDKAVLVTGCDSGFGHGLAKELDRHGVTVFAGCLFPEGSGAKTLRECCSDKLKIIHLDVTKDEHVKEAVRSLTSGLGNKKLWAIVNNAGVLTVGDVEWTPIEEFQKTLEVNTIGLVRTTQAFLPLLRRSKGRVVIVASILGRFTLPGMSAYSMSKHAAVSFADALRKEMMSWSVSVHSIEPYLYSTGLLNKDSVLRMLEKNWDQSPEIVREDYGITYFDRVKRSTRYLSLARPTSKVHEVVDDLMDATIGQNPKICYRPGIEGQISVWLHQYLPVELTDIVTYLLIPKRARKT